MKNKRFSLEQIVAVLKQAEVGLPIAEVVRQSGISEQTFYHWRRVVDQVSHFKVLENARLKQLVADLTLEKSMLQDVLSKILTTRQKRLTHDGDRTERCHRVRRSAKRNSMILESGERILIQ